MKHRIRPKKPVSDGIYIAKHRSCGCVVALISDDGKHQQDTPESVNRLLLAGMVLERVSVTAARKLTLGCTHGQGGQS